MKIYELFDPTPEGYQNEQDDQSVAKITDGRKTRLTLAHLNALRQSHDVRKLEHEKKLKSISAQYAPPVDAGMGGGVGGGLGGMM